jgi:hypothetical protein
MSLDDDELHHEDQTRDAELHATGKQRALSEGLQYYDYEPREIPGNRKGKQRFRTDWQDDEPHINDLPARCKVEVACSACRGLHKELSDVATASIHSLMRPVGPHRYHHICWVLT